MTYAQAIAALPPDAKWSSSFGYPGEGGYTEFHRDTRGVRYIIENGSWLDFAPFTWTMRELAPMPAPPPRA